MLYNPLSPDVLQGEQQSKLTLFPLTSTTHHSTYTDVTYSNKLASYFTKV